MRLKNLLFVLLFFTLTNNIYASEKNGTGQADIGVFSNYMWRGQKLSKGTVIQPSVGITYGSFGANLWTNYDMDSEEHNETDLT